MPIIYQQRIFRQDLRANPNVLYVFGDNLKRQGLAGQAREMRGEPNAIGLPTKRQPSEFLSDSDLPAIQRAISLDQFTLEQKLAWKREIVIWPLDGIGTGLAQLRQRAPLIHQFYEQLRQRLETL